MPRKRRGKVIVVDDAESVREGIVNTLNHEGFVALGAEDGQEASELISRTPGPYFVLVFDLDMPRMSGDQLIAELEAGSSNFDAYVLISGHTEEHPPIKCKISLMGAR